MRCHWVAFSPIRARGHAAMTTLGLCCIRSGMVVPLGKEVACGHGALSQMEVGYPLAWWHSSVRAWQCCHGPAWSRQRGGLPPSVVELLGRKRLGPAQSTRRTGSHCSYSEATWLKCKCKCLWQQDLRGGGKCQNVQTPPRILVTKKRQRQRPAVRAN